MKIRKELGTVEAADLKAGDHVSGWGNVEDISSPYYVKGKNHRTIFFDSSPRGAVFSVGAEFSGVSRMVEDPGEVWWVGHVKAEELREGDVLRSFSDQVVDTVWIGTYFVVVREMDTQVNRYLDMREPVLVKRKIEPGDWLITSFSTQTNADNWYIEHTADVMLMSPDGSFAGFSELMKRLGKL